MYDWFRSNTDPALVIDLETHLGTESALVILDTLELVVDVSSSTASLIPHQGPMAVCSWIDVPQQHALYNQI